MRRLSSTLEPLEVCWNFSFLDSFLLPVFESNSYLAKKMRWEMGWGCFS